jgi:hypothetical protein
MLMTKSGHTSVASLARYARPSAEAWHAGKNGTTLRDGAESAANGFW